MIEAREALKLQALRTAAQLGFSDVDQGRYRDVPEEDLEEHVASLGQRASERAVAASS